MIQINMKMPSSCYDCPFAKNKRTNDYGSFCECGVLEDYETINLLEHSKHPNCPLVEQEPVIDKIRAEVKKKIVKRPWLDFEDRERDRNDAFLEVLDTINKYKAESEGVEDGNKYESI